jgi:hypothetical protein
LRLRKDFTTTYFSLQLFSFKRVQDNCITGTACGEAGHVERKMGGKAGTTEKFLGNCS